MYVKFFKRFLDFILSLIALIVLFPLILILTILGICIMKGNPFFTQLRPGKNEKIFKLIKFRTMTCEKDKDGNLLPDDKRLTRYGKFLRNTSLDEIPQLFNIIVGQMSIVGPRPLLVKYLPLYSAEQHHRHDVRPGLTGYVQAYGRNALTWEDKFERDACYIKQISFLLDIKIIIRTIVVVLKHEGIVSQTSETMEEFKGNLKEISE